MILSTRSVLSVVTAIAGLGVPLALGSERPFGEPVVSTAKPAEWKMFTPKNEKIPSAADIEVPMSLGSHWKAMVRSQSRRGFDRGDLLLARVFVRRFWDRGTPGKIAFDFERGLDGETQDRLIELQEFRLSKSWLEVLLPLQVPVPVAAGEVSVSAKLGMWPGRSGVGSIEIDHFGRGEFLIRGVSWEDFYFFGADFGQCSVSQPEDAVFNAEAFSIEVSKPSSPEAIGLRSEFEQELATGDRIVVLSYLRRGEGGDSTAAVDVRLNCPGGEVISRPRRTGLRAGREWVAKASTFEVEKSSGGKRWSVDFLMGGPVQSLSIYCPQILYIPAQR